MEKLVRIRRPAALPGNPAEGPVDVEFLLRIDENNRTAAEAAPAKFARLHGARLVRPTARSASTRIRRRDHIPADSPPFRANRRPSATKPCSKL